MPQPKLPHVLKIYIAAITSTTLPTACYSAWDDWTRSIASTMLGLALLGRRKADGDFRFDRLTRIDLTCKHQGGNSDGGDSHIDFIVYRGIFTHPLNFEYS
ncbi:hypothetical protein FHX05_004305 [Rhizobium sp. BK491]|nr:hypothetical protein [Rhizobium sp. BK491]